MEYEYAYITQNLFNELKETLKIYVREQKWQNTSS